MCERDACQEITRKTTHQIWNGAHLTFFNQTYQSENLVQAKFESHEFLTLISPVFLLLYYSFHVFLSESCQRERGAVNPEQGNFWKAMSAAWKACALLTAVFGKGLGWVSTQVSYETAEEKTSIGLHASSWSFSRVGTPLGADPGFLTSLCCDVHIVYWLNKPVPDILRTVHCWLKGNHFVPAGSVRHMTLREMIFLSGLQEAEGQKWVTDNGICPTIFMWALCSQIHLDGSELSVTISICQVWIALEELEPSQVKASVKLIEIMHDMDMTSFWGPIN